MYGSRVAWPAGGAEAEAEPAQGRYHARCVARGRHQDQGKPGERSFAAGEPSLKPLHWQLLARTSVSHVRASKTNPVLPQLYVASARVASFIRVLILHEAASATCLAVVREAKVWEREVPSVIAKYFGITSRASPSPLSVVWHAEVVSSVSLV